MKGATIAPATVEVVTLDERTVVGVRQRVAPAEMGRFFHRAIEVTAAELSRRGHPAAGPPTAVYRNESGGEFDVTVGFPVTPPFTVGGGLVVEKLPTGRAARVEHIGPYDTLGATYAALSRWFGRRGEPPPDVMWEEYLVGPGAADQAEFRTRVVCPLS